MELAIYAHPWDLQALADHGGLARLRDLGYRDVALAVSYHAGRWLTPWHPDGLVRFLEDGTVHYRPRADYGLLQPKVSQQVRDGEPSPLEWLCAEAKKAGLRARAWAVGTHNTRLGELHPDCCVENLFGDRYSYALCPGNEHVQQYLWAMAQDLGAHAGLHAIELEAFGWMGWKHSSHHEKASFVPDALTEWLLSVCWCDRCWGSSRDADRGRRGFAGNVHRIFADADAMDPTTFAARGGGPRFEDLIAMAGQGPHDVDPEFLRILWGVFDPRVRLESLLRSVRAHVPEATRLCLQVHPSEHFRGSQAPGSSRYALELGDHSEYVLTCYGDGADGVGKALLALPRPAGKQTTLRLSIHPRAPQFQSDDDLRKVRDLCAQHGVAAISIYHLGLLPWRTIERVGKVLSA